MKYNRLLLFCICFAISCHSNTSPNNSAQEGTKVTQEKPMVARDASGRIDNLVTAMDAVENGINVRKTYAAGDVTYRIQGTYLDSTLIKVVANARSEYALDSQSWYLQNGQPVYYRQFYNDRTCGDTTPQNCLKETILYFDQQNITKALQRNRTIDPTAQTAAFDGETAQPFSPNIDSLTATLNAELAIYINKIKE